MLHLLHKHYIYMLHYIYILHLYVLRHYCMANKKEFEIDFVISKKSQNKFAETD